MNRKETTKFILDNMSISKYTHDILTTFFKNMSDGEFHEFMVKLKNGKHNLSFVIPHEETVTEEMIFDLADKLDVKLFQKLTFHEQGMTHTPVIPYMVIIVPAKRAAQTQDKKSSVSHGNKIDSLTGQVTGDSRSAKITMPEILIHAGFGIEKPIEELMNSRGGDLGLGNAMDVSLFNNGSVSLKNIQPHSTKVVSTKSLKAYLLASHIKSTL